MYARISWRHGVAASPHLIVNWLELDAMTELVGERRAREILSGKGYYEWIYERVLEDTEEIGSVLAGAGLLITPGEGLVVGVDGPSPRLRPRIWQRYRSRPIRWLPVRISSRMKGMKGAVTRGIEGYMARDWEAVRAAKDEYWARRIRRLGPGEGLRIADELRRQVIALDPDWPSEADRQRDWASHSLVAERLRSVDHPRGA